MWWWEIREKLGLDRIMNEQKVLCGWGENQETTHKIMEIEYKTEKQRLMGNIWELSLYATEAI